jgi:hypothetical protein
MSAFVVSGLHSPTNLPCLQAKLERKLEKRKDELREERESHKVQPSP